MFTDYNEPKFMYFIMGWVVKQKFILSNEKFNYVKIINFCLFLKKNYANFSEGDDYLIKASLVLKQKQRIRVLKRGF